MTNKILLSLDIEEFDIPNEYGASLPLAEQIDISAQGLSALLDCFDRRRIVITGFTTGVFAEQRPELVRRMVTAGHEIASHGYSHGSFNNEDLLKSKQVLETISGVPVAGFRRARFATTDPEAILGAGYHYDSSENPIWLPGRYNGWKNPRTLYNKGKLFEFPASASPFLRIPLFWLAFKNFPQWFTRATSLHALNHDGYLNLLFHPWEFADISSYKLPGYVKNPNAERYIDQLDRHIEWLQKFGVFTTFSNYLKET